MVAVSQLLPIDLAYKLPPGISLLLDGSGLSAGQFADLCRSNPDLRIERNANHQIIIMAPTSSETGNFNAEISAEIVLWNRKASLGRVFDSSTGFTLPNGAERAPDTAWIAKARWDALPRAQKQTFAFIVPDFVLELRSKGDNLAALKLKMEEYMLCGCRLGWLIDPQTKHTHVYVENEAIRTVPFDEILTGGEVMPGLEMCLTQVLGL